MNETLRVVLLLFFASHIPITLLVDMQAIFGSYYPTPIREFFLWYGDYFNDPLMAPSKGGGNENKAWLHSFIWSETIFQLPFFFYAVHALYYREALKSVKFLVSSLIYGTHTATTVLPIIATFLASGEIAERERYVLVSVYSPYLLLPAALAANSARELLSFQGTGKKKN
jgi:hypothetical protein